MLKKIISKNLLILLGMLITIFTIPGLASDLHLLWKIDISSLLKTPGIIVRAKPAVSENKVFIATQKGYSNENYQWVISVQSSNGKLLWKRKIPGWGAYNQAVVAKDGEVFVGWSNENRGSVYALNQNNGKIIWSYNLKKGDGWAGAPLEADGKVFFTAMSTGRAYALSAKNGNLLWKTTGLGGFGGGKPVLINIKKGKQELIVSISGGNYTALNPTNGKELWKTGSGYWAVEPVVVGKSKGKQSIFQLSQNINAGAGQADLRCLNISTGNILWDTGNFSNGKGNMTTFAVYGAGKIFFGTNGYNPKIQTVTGKSIYAYNANTGKIVWQRKLDSGVITTPTLTPSGNILVRTSNFIYLLSGKNGSVLSRQYLPGGIYLPDPPASIALFQKKDIAILTGGDNFIYAFSFTNNSIASKNESISIASIGDFYPWIGNRYIDPIYKKKLNKQGYQIGHLEYSDVTINKLNPYNLCVLQWAPNEGQIGHTKIYEEKIPIFEKYVRDGGGLLITCEPGYGAYKNINKLLKIFGAQIIPESIIDPKNDFRQNNYLRWWFGRTTNLNSKNPISKGIRSFIYPLGYAPDGGEATLPLKLNRKWHWIIKAMPGAKTTNGISEPVIMAERQYGKGRIVLMPMHTTFFFNAGYFPIWQGLTMVKGNGYKILNNVYQWLAEPSLDSGIIGGYIQPKKQKLQKITLTQKTLEHTDIYQQMLLEGEKQWTTFTLPVKKNDYIGLIGVHTSLSDGTGTVKDYVKAAKEKGYNFIIFTEKFSDMNAKKWTRLVSECKKASSNKFLAIPGIAYKDTTGNRYISFNLPRWPDKSWLNKKGTEVANTPGFYFGLDWVPVYAVNPLKNPTKPWYLKFYSGMEVIYYFRNSQKPINDFSQYLQVQGNDYNGIPIVGRQIYSPSQIPFAIDGYQTHVMAKNVQNIPSCFKYYWYAQRNTYISSGPIIHEFYIKNDNSMREIPWKLYINVSSKNPITDIIIYDRKNIFYRFSPDTKHFVYDIKGYNDQQRFLTMKVIDSKGRIAISPSVYTGNSRQATYMCTDMQNTLNSMNAYYNGRIHNFGVMGGYVTGWDSLSPGILVTGSKLMPPGLDYVVGGFGGGVSPAIWATSGYNGGAVAQRDMVFSSGDVNMLDNYFLHYFLPGSIPVPTKYFQARVRYISYTPRPFSENMMLIQTQSIFKKDLTFATTPNPDFSLIGIGLPSSSSFTHYTYININGRKFTGKRNSKVTLQGEIERGGYISLWPDFYGSVAVYPLTKGVKYSFNLSGNNLTIGENLAGISVKKGEKTPRQTFLVVRGKFGDNTDKQFEQISDLYGLKNGIPAYNVKLTKGKIIHKVLVPVLHADRYTVKGEITKAGLPNDLGVEIRGLNPNWDAGLYNRITGQIRRIGVRRKDQIIKEVGYFTTTKSPETGDGYFTANINYNNLKFIAGNLLLCNNPHIRLHLYIPYKVKIEGTKQQVKTIQTGPAEITINNPTTQTITAIVQGNPYIKQLSTIRKTITLKPGEIKTFKANIFIHIWY
jgi:outer membrane protein assembly factor BamB